MLANKNVEISIENFQILLTDLITGNSKDTNPGKLKDLFAVDYPGNFQQY